MIDFKQLLTDNPRFSKRAEMAALINEIELELKNKIEKNSDQGHWTVTRTSPMSIAALKEMHTFLCNEFVAKKLTQMRISFREEVDHGSGCYNPAAIEFSVYRADFE